MVPIVTKSEIAKAIFASTTFVLSTIIGIGVACFGLTAKVHSTFKTNVFIAIAEF